MSGKKRSGHYCKICGEWKANEKFSGSGHAKHICKSCAKLPAEKKAEILTVDRIMDLPEKLSRDHRAWLEKLMEDENAQVKSAAAWAYNSRFAPEWVEDVELSDADLAELFGPPLSEEEEFDDELPF